MDATPAGIDPIARARKLTPLLAAAAPRIDAARELPPRRARRDACRRHVPPAGATRPRRLRAGSRCVYTVRRGNRRRRRIGRVVHEPGLRLFDVRRLSAPRSRARSLWRRARRARLGHGSRRQGDPCRGWLAHHRQLGVRQRQPPRDMARRALSMLRSRRYTATLFRWPPSRTHHALPARARDDQGYLAGGGAARNGQQLLCGDRSFRR